jgi:hypothetical protein
MREDTKEQSDRAAIKRTISVLDGLFGSEMEVIATEEGLEFESGSTLSWEWIDSAHRSVRPSGADVQPLNSVPRSADDGLATAL